MALATGSVFSLIEVESGSLPLEAGGVDIADAFYHIELIEELREYFGLPALNAGQVGLESNGEKIGENHKVYPCLKVIPMGWMRASWVCQKAHEHIVDGIPSIKAGVDHKPVPNLNTCTLRMWTTLFASPSRSR